MGYDKTLNLAKAFKPEVKSRGKKFVIEILFFNGKVML